MVTSLEVRVRDAMQLSVAVAIATTGTEGQSMVVSTGNAAIAGAIISWITANCVQVLVFPSLSAIL